jgi:MoxR-like ATPase
MLSAALTVSSSAGEDWKVIAPLIAAAIALIGVLMTLVVNGRRAERERLRRLYADGWAAVQAYKEMAFAIRRRNAEDRARERVRLSEALRGIQNDLAYHEALIGHERSGEVAAEYRTLVAKTREIAGGIIRRSWGEEPITSDREMHSPEIASELEPLNHCEKRYMRAVAAAVSGRARIGRQR